MKQLYDYSANRVNVVSLDPDQTVDVLKPMVYSVGFSEMMGYFLNIQKDKFELPDVIFGNHKSRVAKVINTFNDRDSSTGVLLTGNKGSGKTMLTEMVSNELIEQGLPVVLINEEFTGDGFFNFINSLGDCVLIFDEFAKVYEEYQDSLLGLLDGTLSGKRLVLLTENDCYRISRFMLNRPGRIFYHFDYDKLDESAIREFCVYHGVEAVIDDILYVSRRVNDFSIDILQSIVEDYKRYNEPVDEIIKDLNIDWNDLDLSVEIVSIKDPTGHESTTIEGSPYISERKIKSRDFCYITYRNKKNDVMSVDVDVDDIVFEDNETIIFETNHDYKVLGIKRLPVKVNYGIF